MKKRTLSVVLCLVLLLSFGALARADELSGSLKYMVWGSTVERDIVQGIVDSYNESHPNVNVELLYVPNSDYDTKVATMVAGGSEPDIAYMSEALCYELYENGLLMNLYDFVNGDQAKFKYDEYVDGVWYRTSDTDLLGRRIGIAAWCLYYNKDCAAQAGVTFPAKLDDSLDWDTFVSGLRKMTLDGAGKTPDDEGFDPENIAQYGFSFKTELTVLETMMNAHGVSWSNEDGTSFEWASPEGIQAMQKIADLINVHHVAPTPVQSKSLPGASVTLTSGIVAATIDGNWNCADFAAAGANFDIGVLPNAGYKYGLQGCSPTVMFKSTKNPALAWDFYQYVADPENALPFYTSGISIPVIKSWLEDADKLQLWTDNEQHPAGYVGGLLEPLATGKAPSTMADTIKNYAQQRDLVLAALQPVWTGEKTAEEVLSAIKPDVEALMNGKYPR